MDFEYTSLAYIASNVIAVFTVVTVVLWSNIGRVLLSGIFIGAAVTNAITATYSPSLYLQYSEMAILDLYKHIIVGPFSRNITRYVLAISAGQLLTGVYLLQKGMLQKIAAWGGILFLVATWILPSPGCGERTGPNWKCCMVNNVLRHASIEQM
jgi:hypothetical protein